MVKPGPQKKEPYRRLAEINRAITTSLNFDEVLKLIVENAAQLVSARVTLLLLLGQDGLLEIRSSQGADPELMASFVGRMEEDVIKKLQASLGVRSDESLASVPIIAKHSLNGLLVIVRDVPLNEEEEWQMSALADQAAIALRNARLYEMELAEANREREVTLEALSSSTRRINRILESITDLFYSLDNEWRFRDVNKQTEIRFGKKRAELLGKVIWEVFPAAVDSALYPQFHKAIEEKVPVHFELESRIVRGAWFEAHAYPSKAGLTVYLRDITERKEAEVTSRLLAAIVESSDDAIVSKDLNGTINSWNKGAERIFGYTIREVLGQPISIVISDISMPEMDGYQLLRTLRSLPSMAKVPALALTGHGRRSDMDRTRKEGFAEHFIKPLDLDRLLQTVRQLTERRTSPTLAEETKTH